MHSSVGIEDNVSQQIGNDQGIVPRTAGVFYNIAVPVQQRPVMTVELADLEPFLQIIAGTAMGKSSLGIQRFPFCQNIIIVLFYDNIIF